MARSSSTHRRSTSSHRRFHVVGLGQCSLDYLCTIQDYPRPDSKCEFKDFSIQGGGPVATALVLLVRWGASARFVGLISNDTFGKSIQKGLGKEGVDISGMVIRKGRRSQFAFICIERQTGRRNIYWSRPDCAPITPDEVPIGSIAAADVLHLDGLFVEASIHAAQCAKRNEVPVVLDAGSLRPGMLDVVRLTDHLIAAEHFVEEYAHGESYESALCGLKKLGPQVVVVTLGERGSMGVWDEEIFYFPPLPVKAVDTTGAGDVFHGAYIYGLLHEWAAPERIRLATAAAALNCRAIGARAGIPTLEEARENMTTLAPCTPWTSSAQL